MPLADVPGRGGESRGVASTHHRAILLESSGTQLDLRVWPRQQFVSPYANVPAHTVKPHQELQGGKARGGFPEN